MGLIEASEPDIHHQGGEETSENTVLKAALELVASSADLIEENMKLTGSLARAHGNIEEAAKRLDAMSKQLDGDHAKEADAIATLLRQ